MATTADAGGPVAQAFPFHRPAAPGRPSSGTAKWWRPLVDLLIAPLWALAVLARGVVRRPSSIAAATVVLVAVPGRGSATTVDVTPADLASLLLVAVALGGAVLTGRRPLSRPALVLFGGIALALVLSTVTSTDVAASLPGLVRYLQLFVLVPVAVVVAVEDRRDMAVVCGAFVGVAVLQGVVGTAQVLTGTGASYGGEPVRAVGTFGAGDVLAMAGVVAYGLIVSLGLAMVLRGWRQVALLVAAGALVVPLALSLSRGTWIAAAVAVPLVLLARSARTALATVVCTGAVVVLLVGGFGIGSATLGERVASIASSTSQPDQSVEDRYALWGSATSMWTESPVTGVGLRQFPRFRDDHAPVGLSAASDTEDPSAGFVREPLLSPHNQFLLVLSEQGLVGLLAFGSLIAVLVVQAARRVDLATAPHLRPLRPVVLGLMAFSVVTLSVGDVGGASSVLVAVVLGLAARWSLAPAPRVPQAPVRPRLRPPRLVAPEAPTAGGRVQRAVDLGQVRVLVTALTVLGVVLGLGRDLLLAHAFGASGDTDAFLVAWSVPETAAPLLVEDAMAFLLIPAFTRALLAGRAAVAELFTRTLLPVAVLLAAVTALCVVGAPALVRLLAPGLDDPGLAVACMRWTSLSVLCLGVAGYIAAALRAHGVFGPPAALSLASNAGIVLVIAALADRLGVLSAAVGVAVGASLMVAVQLPALLRRVGLPRPGELLRRRVGAGASPAVVVTLGAFVPIALYTLTRQGQVFAERFFASDLPPGTISHLNFAQKVGQLPVTLVLVLVLVSFPLLAERIVTGRLDEARRQVEDDLRLVLLLVLPAVAFLVVFAPAVVQLLFQRGAFDADDTAATAAVLRLYVVGLAGQGMVGVLCRCSFSGGSSWAPFRLMAVALVVTFGSGALLAPVLGAPGLAAANAIGITVAAVLLLVEVNRRVVPLSPLLLLGTLGRLAVAAVAAAGAALGWARLAAGMPPLVVVVPGGLLVLLVFAAAAGVLDPGTGRVARAALRHRGGPGASPSGVRTAPPNSSR